MSVPLCLSVCQSVRPSVRPHGTTRTPVDGHLLNSMSQCFPKICRENTSFTKISRITGTLNEYLRALTIESRKTLLSIREMFRTKIVVKSKYTFYVQ